MALEKPFMKPLLQRKGLQETREHCGMSDDDDSGLPGYRYGRVFKWIGTSGRCLFFCRYNNS